MVHRFHYCLVVLLTALLAACGGGGSGNGNSGGGAAVDNCPASSVALSYPAINTSVGNYTAVSPTGVPAACSGASYAVVGTLPAGLSLNPSTGVISGTPTGTGSSSFSVQMTLPVSGAVLGSNATTVTVLPAGASVVISGTAMNTVISNSASGALNFAAPVLKPMRGLVVEVVQGGAVIATAPTSETGAYSLTLPVNKGLVYLRIKAALQSTTAPTWNVQVKDNTNSNAIYALTSSTFTVGTANITQNVTAASGWSSTGAVVGTRASAPFAILDTVYSAMKKVTAVAPTTAFAPLNIYWSINNTPANGNVAIGQIPTSYFTFSNNANSIYILGKDGVDTDEFDDSVIAHEWGHYAQSSLWRDDSIGGQHGTGDKLDMRVSFSEGWGNAWSGIATNKSVYADSSWYAGAARGFVLNLSQSPASSANRGWFSEESVYYTIYSLYSQVGLAPIWQALLAMKNDDALSTIYSLQANLPAGAASTTMATLMASQGNTGVGAFAVGETNMSSYPPYRSLTLGVPRSNVCVGKPYGTFNKVGNYAALKFNNPNAGGRTIRVTGSSSTDPDFEVYQKGVVLYTAESSNPGSETQMINISTGDFVILVKNYPSTTAACFSVLVQ